MASARDCSRRSGAQKDAMMSIGTVKSFDRRKGSGLIAPDGGGADVFVHVSAVERAGLPNIEAGDRLRFDTQTDRMREKSFATNLVLLGQ
jgi:cold shock protein